jgi:valyl-tRNA synthetase
VIHYQSPHEDDQHSLSASAGVVKAVGRISELQIVAAGTQLPPSATASIDQRTISSPLAGLIDDPAAELARLEKRKAKTRQDLGREEAKLKNTRFIDGAPAEIVAEVHTRIANFQRQIAEVEQQEQVVSALVARRRA